MKKLLTLRAIQILKGDDAVCDEILRALRKTGGNMREACVHLGISKTSMYRLIEDLGDSARKEIDDLLAEKGYRIRGKVRDRTEELEKVAIVEAVAAQPRPRTRTRKAAGV